MRASALWTLADDRQFEGHGDLYQAFGDVVNNVGDFDSDGRDDFFVGPKPVWAIECRLDLVMGRDGRVLGDVGGKTEIAELVGREIWEDYCLPRVVALDDLDGDGLPELAVTLFVDTMNGDRIAGSLLGIAGTLDATRFDAGAKVALGNEGPANEFGGAVALLGDLDGDHVSDLVVGDPSRPDSEASVHVLSGSDGRVLWTLEPARDSGLGGAFGSTLATWVDGAERPHLAVGAPGRARFLNDDERAAGIGSVWIFDGAKDLGLVLHAPEPDDGFGEALAWDRETTEGRPDLFISAPHHDPGYVTRVASDGEVRWRTVGDPNGSHFGMVLAVGGDYDGDGTDDVFVSASAAPDAKEGRRPRPVGVAPPPGRVWLLSGADGSPLAELAGAPDERLGASLAVGNLDGDDLLDLVVGAPRGVAPRALHGSKQPYSGGHVYAASGARIAEHVSER